MRLAIFCTECNARHFGDPDWRCVQHPTKCVVQKNHPYFGKEIPTIEVDGLVIESVDEVAKKAKKK